MDLVPRTRVFCRHRSTRASGGQQKPSGFPSQPCPGRFKNFKSDLGAPLFVRTPHGASLTPFSARRCSCPYARWLFRSWRMACGTSRDMTGQAHGLLHVGLIYSLGTRFLPDVIRAFARTHPAVTVQLAEAPAPTFFSTSDGEIDIAFAHRITRRTSP